MKNVYLSSAINYKVNEKGNIRFNINGKDVPVLNNVLHNSPSQTVFNIEIF